MKFVYQEAEKQLERECLILEFCEERTLELKCTVLSHKDPASSEKDLLSAQVLRLNVLLF